jgi:hypothetical protein
LASFEDGSPGEGIYNFIWIIWSAPMGRKFSQTLVVVGTSEVANGRHWHPKDRIEIRSGNRKILPQFQPTCQQPRHLLLLGKLNIKRGGGHVSGRRGTATLDCLLSFSGGSLRAFLPLLTRYHHLYGDNLATIPSVARRVNEVDAWGAIRPSVVWLALGDDHDVTNCHGAAAYYPRRAGLKRRGAGTGLGGFPTVLLAINFERRCVDGQKAKKRECGSDMPLTALVLVLLLLLEPLDLLVLSLITRIISVFLVAGHSRRPIQSCRAEASQGRGGGELRAANTKAAEVPL